MPPSIAATIRWTFEGPDGEAWEWFPPLAAVRARERLFGWDAWTAQEDPQATIVRSIKRFLQDAGPQTTVQIGSQSLSMLDLLCGITGALRKGLLEDSSLTVPAGEPIEVMLGVPANANGNQRFLTVEAFRRAGFLVTGLLNEPTAASVEFGHAHRKKQPLHSGDAVLVYDLGGGTFDASLVVVEQKTRLVDVEVLGDGQEAHAQRDQLLDGADAVGHGTAPAVELPKPARRRGAWCGACSRCRSRAGRLALAPLQPVSTYS